MVLRRQGDAAESLYIIISGRLRLLREDPAARLPLTVEEEVCLRTHTLNLAYRVD